MQEKPISELLEFGILNIDKPSGPTSFQVDELVKKKLGLRKVSHFGTLDPKVTGVLPLALNRACKLLRWFISKEKEYVGIMKLHKPVAEKDLEKAMEKFVGKIKQVPPRRSRVKRQVRERQVYSLKLLEYDKEKKEALFSCKVEGGTYVRKLIHDLGLEIGGAHMLELRRTKAGIFSENDNSFINLYEFEKAVEEYKKGREEMLKKIIIPADKAIKKILPSIEIKSRNLKQILTGKPIFKEDIKGKLKVKEGNVAVFSGKRFIEVARIVNEGKIIARPEFVFN